MNTWSPASKLTAAILGLSLAAPALADEPTPVTAEVAQVDSAAEAPAPTESQNDQRKARAKKNKKNDKHDNSPGVGPFKRKDYPLSERLRPLVLPNKMGEVTLDLTIARVSAPVVASTPTSSASRVAGTATPTTTDDGDDGSNAITAVGTNVVVLYGLGDKFELGAGTGLLLSPDFDWNRTLSLQAHYLAKDSRQFDFAPGLYVPINTVEGAGFGVVVDLPCRYVLSDGVFLRFGHGALPLLLSPDFGLAVAGNLGAGFQLDVRSVILLDASVFNLSLSPGDPALSGFWDYLNLSAGFQYTPVTKWDVGGALTLTNYWGVENSFGFGVRAYGTYRF